MRGHIRERGPNTWQLIWYAGRKPDGRPDYHSCTVHGSKEAAEGKLATILASIYTGEYVAPAKETVGQYLNRWLEEIRPSVRPKTWAWYKMQCQLYLIPNLGQIPLQKLAPLHIQSLYRKLLESGRTGDTSTGKKGQGLSPAAVRGVHRTLRRALGLAVKWGLLVRNPAEAVEQPKRAKAEQKTLAPEEIARLLDASKKTERYSFYLAAVTTGMREGELLGLRWQDVDLERGTATVKQQLSRAGEHPSFSEPKTAHGARIVSLPESLVVALRKAKSVEEEERKAYGKDYQNYDLVWHVPGGRPINPRNLNRQFKSLLKKAGLPDMRFHDLRHTHATILLQAGTHPKVVQERLGHSQIAVTMDTYSHVIPALQTQAAQDIDKLLFGKRNIDKN